jgi:aminoglycoside phosphotransferase family enzyme
MRRFDERQSLTALHARGELGLAEIDALAGQLASFHRRAPRMPPRAAFGTAACVQQQMQTVLQALERAAGTRFPARIAAWCDSQGRRLAGHFDARRADGLVRACHGDLHLDYIVRRGKRVFLFDCIEFDPALRWIDVASDLSFPLMDLQAHGRPELAARLLNGWLQRTGDFAALPALRYYMVYRALVRAFVAATHKKVPNKAVSGQTRFMIHLYWGCRISSTARAAALTAPRMIHADDRVFNHGGNVP